MKKLFKRLFDGENKKVRRGVAVVGIIALVCCVGVIHNKIQSDNNLNVSAGYEQYEEDALDQHNGDVLVDSLNLTAIKGSSQENGAGEDSTGDAALDKNSDIKITETDLKTSMVTSDDASILENTDEYFREARETLASDRGEMISMLTKKLQEQTNSNKNSDNSSNSSDTSSSSSDFSSQ
ncbi:MAG: hypothetical protein IKV96_05100, partial [Firmicutes bacterium]|nr:hypothetical protein [Bacillota bacterium]